MFRLWALHRACRMHSFLFSPLAARPVHHGRGCHLSRWTGLFSPSWCHAGRRLIPGKAGGRQASCSQLWRCFVVLAWVNRFTHHQYKHRCWCYQWLLLVCLFICIKLVTRNPLETWEHPDQRAVREPAAIVFSNMTLHAVTWICPIPRMLTQWRVARAWQDAWSALRPCGHSERSVLNSAEPSADWGLVTRPPQPSVRGTVALGCPVWAAAPPACVHCVSCNRTEGPRELSQPSTKSGWMNILIAGVL